jgi:glycyl-tRNA synthetase
VLHLSPKIAPTKAAVFPLVKRDGMPELAQKIVEDIRPHYMAFYDQGGAVGRRYWRMDEVGTPYCITVDTESLEQQSVTICDRDTMQQDRISVDKIKEYLDERILFVG